MDKVTRKCPQTTTTRLFYDYPALLWGFCLIAVYVGWLLGWFNWFNGELSPKRVLTGTAEIPGGGGRGILSLTLCCHH